MSAEVLQEAAAAIRADRSAGEFQIAVAGWLEAVAVYNRHRMGLSGCRERISKRPPNAHGECPACHALDVARTYLSGAA